MTSLPLINQAYEKIKENGSLTDEELAKSLTKSGIVIPEDRFNKILLDLEILGKIRVSWLTKDTRRIEAITEEEIDEVESQNRESMERDYEASFPGMENSD
jgi:hypothetical protein